MCVYLLKISLAAKTEDRRKSLKNNNMVNMKHELARIRRIFTDKT